MGVTQSGTRVTLRRRDMVKRMVIVGFRNVHLCLPQGSPC
jgi:hypothetical protein